MSARNVRPTLQSGFTLVELIIVIVLLGIMSAYAIMKSASVAEATLPSQAEKMASDIRQAQTLAYTTGQRMRLTVNPSPLAPPPASLIPSPLGIHTA